MKLKLNRSDKRRFTKTIGNLKQFMSRDTEKILAEVVAKTVERMKKDAPVAPARYSRSGALKQSIKGKVAKGHAEIVATEEYAGYVEHGPYAQPFFWKNIRKGIRDFQKRILTSAKKITR